MSRRKSTLTLTRQHSPPSAYSFKVIASFHLPAVNQSYQSFSHTFTLSRFTLEAVSSASTTPSRPLPSPPHGAVLPFSNRKLSSCREEVPAVVKYLFCFAEPDFAPRQGHQHSAFVAAELQQAQLVCRGEVGEAVGGLLGAADGGWRGRLKRFYPLLLLPCGRTWRREQRKSS